MADMHSFMAAIEQRARWVDELLLDEQLTGKVKPSHMRDLVRTYIEQGGKRLRPAVLLFCCGAVGGDERSAVPAAAAVELFHTWTLMHDDIIDQDALRRGGPSGHTLAEALGQRDLHLEGDKAGHYGMALAMLAGDVQHGMCVSLLLQAEGAKDGVRMHLLHKLERDVVCDLVEGEALDIQLENKPLQNVTLDEVLRMTYLKTAVLYEFAAGAGAMLGLNTTAEQHPSVRALTRFCSECGVAFQLQDDILGITADEGKLGKPVGSDIIQGKRTSVAVKAYEMSDRSDRARIAQVMDDPGPTQDAVREVADLISRAGAVDAVGQMARQHIRKAYNSLEPIPASQYKDWLTGWAEYMIERDF